MTFSPDRGVWYKLKVPLISLQEYIQQKICSAKKQKKFRSFYHQFTEIEILPNKNRETLF